MHLQPSYYFNSESGTGTGNTAFEYGVNAIIIMPMMRIYAMENNIMSLFFQFGVGWGQAYGTIHESTDQTDFTGSSLGYQGGLGLAICYMKTHCLNLEANLRVLDIERNISDKSTVAQHSVASALITQSGAGKEVEISDKDLGVNLTGVQILAGYVFRY